MASFLREPENSMPFLSRIEREIWWLGSRRVAGMPRPKVAVPRRHTPSSSIDKWDDDLPILWANDFRSIICLTDPRDEGAFTAAGFKFLPLETQDGHPPKDGQIETFLHFYNTSPKSIGIHCEGGIGRTGTMLAIILMSEGLDADSAISEVRAHNSSAIETSRQEQFLRDLNL